MPPRSAAPPHVPLATTASRRAALWGVALAGAAAACTDAPCASAPPRHPSAAAAPSGEAGPGALAAKPAGSADPAVAGSARPAPSEVGAAASAAPSTAPAPAAPVGAALPDAASAPAASSAASSAAPPPSLPAVSFRTVGIHVGGGPNDAATHGLLRGAVEPAFPELTRCWAQAESTHGGTFGVDLVIPRGGGRAEVRQVRTSLKGAALRECFSAALRAVEFPPLPAGKTVVSYSVAVTL